MSRAALAQPPVWHSAPPWPLCLPPVFPAHLAPPSCNALATPSQHSRAAVVTPSCAPFTPPSLLPIPPSRPPRATVCAPRTSRASRVPCAALPWPVPLSHVPRGPRSPLPRLSRPPPRPPTHSSCCPLCLSCCTTLARHRPCLRACLHPLTAALTPLVRAPRHALRTPAMPCAALSRPLVPQCAASPHIAPHGVMLRRATPSGLRPRSPSRPAPLSHRASHARLACLRTHTTTTPLLWRLRESRENGARCRPFRDPNAVFLLSLPYPRGRALLSLPFLVCTGPLHAHIFSPPLIPLLASCPHIVVVPFLRCHAPSSSLLRVSSYPPALLTSRLVALATPLLCCRTVAARLCNLVSSGLVPARPICTRPPCSSPPQAPTPASRPHHALAPLRCPSVAPLSCASLLRAPFSFAPLAPSHPRALLVPFAHSPRRRAVVVLSSYRCCAIVVPSSYRRRAVVALVSHRHAFAPAPRAFAPAAPSRLCCAFAPPCSHICLVIASSSPCPRTVVTPSSYRRRAVVALMSLPCAIAPRAPSHHRAPVLAHSPRCHPVVTPSPYRCCPALLALLSPLR
ncbi:hypothetical protein DENSPDRAFT_881712 [Dentipellis sp. KUC8613]|nr:hypothetical protein DENSPDRAFT_881712 [Dentipellis sp. KUC8613]